MSLKDLKFTEEQLAGSDIASLPDRPGDAGMTAADLKARFDAIPKALLALGAFNSLIDRLSAEDAAEYLGAMVEGINSKTVHGVLTALKRLHDTLEESQNTTNASILEALNNRYTKDQSDTLLGKKFDTVKANEMVRSIEFNADTGVFTITTQGGTVSTIDTMLEKVPANFSLENNQLVLTLEDGTKQTADLSSFIDTYTFTNGSTVQFSQNGKNISAEVKDESLELTKLTPAAQAALASYAERAEVAQERAQAAQAAAKVSETAAAASASSIEGDVGDAKASAGAAKQSENNAKQSETNAKESETAAQAAQRAAEQARDEAQAVAGGDFLPIAGGTLTGKLTLDGAPTANLHAATKKYVDDAVGNIPTPDVSGQIGTHNTSGTAHSDIRTLVSTAQTAATNAANAAAAAQATADSKAPAYTYGTDDLEAGATALETGKLYFVYE